MKPRLAIVAASLVLVVARSGWSQTTPLIPGDQLKAIITESSGSRAIDHFRRLLSHAGYSPSAGADQASEYLAARVTEYGLTNVHTDRFPSDGKITFWTFATQPAWEGSRGDLSIAGAVPERVASFNDYRGHLARFSRTGKVRAVLIDVGAGTTPRDYEGKDVTGKIVLASGTAGPVHEHAVWQFGAAGVVTYRTQDYLNYPDLVGPDQIVPWEGPKGEPPTFAFSVSYRTGRRLADRLRNGERLTLEADVVAETRPGAYPQVHATIAGTDPSLPEVWVYAHSDYRNSGGANNLTGTGATLEAARALARLIERGSLPKPRRNIRFVWGAEHQASVYYVHQNPEAPKSILAMLNLDMVGYDQEASQSILHMYRTAHSLPSFVSDVVQDVFEIVGSGNNGVLKTRLMALEGGFTMPIVDPAGSRDPFFYGVDDFWGPSDHEDLGDGSIGIPGVLINNWPVAYLGTNVETVAMADATQMRRAVVIGAASAWILASSAAPEVPGLALNAVARAEARLAAEERRAANLLLTAPAAEAPVHYREARNIVRQAYRRESRALETLQALADTRDARDYVMALAREMLAGETPAQERLARTAAVTARKLGKTLTPAPADSSPASRLVPVRAPTLRGPIRPQWLAEQLKDPYFLNRLGLARRGQYYLYETLNFADGQRTLGEIRDAVAAEYGPAPLEEIEAYFRLLEKVGVLTLRRPAA